MILLLDPNNKLSEVIISFVNTSLGSTNLIQQNLYSALCNLILYNPILIYSICSTPNILCILLVDKKSYYENLIFIALF